MNIINQELYFIILDINSREYEDFIVIQSYEDLEILVSLVRLAGETQLQRFRNRVVTEATMPRFEFLTRQDIHHPLKLTEPEGYLCLQLISLARSRRNKICLIAR